MLHADELSKRWFEAAGKLPQDRNPGKVFIESSSFLGYHPCPMPSHALTVSRVS